MATSTPNYNLKKPDLIDFYNIQDQNDNMDLIDTALKGLEDGKVAKVAGKGLSTEDYTTAEKSKLAGVEAGATADQTASEIKTLYESNANTNAYTDTEKSKLAGIQAGAQVNAVTSVAGKTGAVTLAKADVGLGSVENYGIATQAEAEAGTSDTKYMTPMKVLQSISKNAAKVASGTYTGTGATWTYNVGFTPKLVLIISHTEYQNNVSWLFLTGAGIIFRINAHSDLTPTQIVTNGFQIDHGIGMSYSGIIHSWFALA